MTSENYKKRLPPYISYRTFEAFIGRLQQQVPARIDRSYWGELHSGSTGVQLMAALRFLKLVDNLAAPTEKLRSIAANQGEQRKELLRLMTMDAYDFALNNQFDIENATHAQMEELFQNTFNLKPDVCRKCLKFFISLAMISGIQISQFVTKKVRQVKPVGTYNTARNSINKSGTKAIRNEQVPILTKNNGIYQTTANIFTELLNKFPDFNPTWSDEVQKKWFSAYDELLKRYPPAADRNSQ